MKTTIVFPDMLTLTSVDPLSGAPGATITLTGTDFQPGLAIDIGGVEVTPATISPTVATFAMPSSPPCDTVITVTNPTTNSASLPFNPSPSIMNTLLAVGPASGGGTFVIQGDYFFPGTTVTVGGASATILGVTQDSIQAQAPPGSLGIATVIVTSPAGCTATTTYLYQ